MITFKTKGNMHYVKYGKVTAVFDRLSDAWRFLFKLWKELKANGR
jgi:hypothetical protein